jgi:menaquinol-cytochrome c reductase iron-sulfur subunit
MENKPVKKSSAAPDSKGSKDAAAPDDRRGFVTKAVAVVAGGVVTACPVAAGVAVFMDPLLHKTAVEGRKIRVASLHALPDDGVPRQFPVIVDSRDDAWNRFHGEPIGSVFLRRKPGSRTVEAFNATCPHAGCFVAFKTGSQQYACPCHESAFNIDGQPVFGPSPRALDELQTEVDKQEDIWVIFQEFYTGIQEKKPKT